MATLGWLVSGPAAQSRPPLSNADLDDIATLLRLEDTRTLDEAALTRILKSSHTEVRRRAVVAIGRIAKEPGRVMLVPLRTDSDVDVRASVAFATGQLKDPSAIDWLDSLLQARDTPPVSPARPRRRSANTTRQSRGQLRRAVS